MQTTTKNKYTVKQTYGELYNTLCYWSIHKFWPRSGRNQYTLAKTTLVFFSATQNPNHKHGKTQANKEEK